MDSVATVDECNDTMRVRDCLEHRNVDKQRILTRGIPLRHQIRKLADVPMDSFPVWTRQPSSYWMEAMEQK